MPLCDRLLDSSSDTDQYQQSYLRYEYTIPKKCHRIRKRNNREQEKNQEQSVVSVCRTPDWINIQGPLAFSTEFIIFEKIYEELECYQNKHPSNNLLMYVKAKLEMSNRDDMAVISHIQGIAASRDITGDIQQALTQCKQIIYTLHTYHLKNPGIIASQVYWLMYDYYMYKRKPGKAYSALQAAVGCTQHHAPSLWTARVCDLQGIMYDRLAQIRPGHRKKYQDMALRCYTKAREHCLFLPGQDEINSYYPILHTLHMTHIMLDMPTLNTISEFSKSDIVYQRLIMNGKCTVPLCHVIEAQKLLTCMESQVTRLTAVWRAYPNECICIGSIVVNIRLTQLAINKKEYKVALDCIESGIVLYDKWSKFPSIYTDTHFKNYPDLAQGIKLTLDEVYGRLIIISQPEPPPEPLSDSLSSELSDIPPSGLKILTDESMMVEKQAKRNAYQFTYSSGDIFSRSDDVSTDLN